MLNKELLNKAIEKCTSELESECNRCGKGEIILVPVRVEVSSDGHIGMLSHTKIMQEYNNLI